MKKHIEKLQFITHDIKKHNHIEQASIACQAGAKWIQYRCLTKNDTELLKDIHAIAEICDDWGTTLIVTNHIHLKNKADIQGFHIEDMDADFVALRKELGNEFILGGSANTLENIQRLSNENADYIGFGPYNLTTTKPNQMPLLGTKGYENAMQQLSNIPPILAVGGIELKDVNSLLATKIHGIAVSSAINQAEDLYDAYKSFYQLIY